MENTKQRRYKAHYRVNIKCNFKRLAHSVVIIIIIIM